ncbi:MAG TPA: dihydrodipicolinate synthase family protein [Acetobacteraceae bacterium]|nr:dihydrodipicolinate synthase family protein [Acetobacteraceae bacterium]
MRYGPGEARDWARASLHGYMTILYTPFDEAGALDEAGLRHNVRETLARPGVGGLSVHSLHQESWALTIAERKRLAEVVLDEVAGRAPVVIGCSDPAAVNVVDLAQHAEAAGADLVMVWPPYFGPRTAESVRHFYEYVATRIGIGMVVYSTTLAEQGYYLDPGQVEALLHLRNVCAVQDTTLNFASFARMMERVGERICVSTSLEEYFLHGQLAFPERAPGFLIGSSRPVLCQTSARPHCGRFMEAVRARDFAEAARQARIIAAIADRLQSRYFARGFHHVGLFKAVAGMLGMETGHPSRPAAAAPREAELRECAAVLASAGLIERRRQREP